MNKPEVKETVQSPQLPCATDTLSGIVTKSATALFGDYETRQNDEFTTKLSSLTNAKVQLSDSCPTLKERAHSVLAQVKSFTRTSNPGVSVTTEEALKEWPWGRRYARACARRMRVCNRALFSPEDAEHAAWLALVECHGPRSVLGRAIYFRVVDAVRHSLGRNGQRVQNHLTPDMEPQAPADCSTEDRLLAHILLQALTSEERRDAELYYLEGKRVEEIAAMTGRTAQRVWYTLRQARERMRRKARTMDL